ncbi:E3.2.1.4 [Mytilus edulis]|uniref:Endoglucanase n=1 Tax=Mytilus edulis TaxID=6550 RepID=A0A8S3UCR2_MYTED|nr:E3.2.1.4 [Mytilus edulis]
MLVMEDSMGHFIFNLTEDLVGWKIQIDFSKAVTGLTSPIGLEYVKDSSNETVHYLVNKDHTGIQTTNPQFDVMVQGITKDANVPSAQAYLQNMGHDNFKPPIPSNTDGTKYNYDEVLMKSIMFYLAQRSGKLPANNPIPWREDSALNDRGQNGEDLTGGWYDAGDHVKFGLPQASAVTLLTWGLLQYKDAYNASGQLDEMYDCIRWSLEWLLKCHTGKNELYIQVGDGNLDHSFWGRPEDMTMDRPSFKVTSDKPGSDVAGEYAAAMAVASIVFKDKDPAFSIKLLNHSKEIYTFGKTYPGLFRDSVKGAGYGTSDYKDEMAVGAGMLYLATNNSQYLTDAESFHQHGNQWGQSWENKYTASMVGFTIPDHQKDVYKQDIETTFGNWLPGATGPSAVPYTPKGLAYRTKWGSLRHADMKYPNPHILYGALVGGPGQNDEYDDVRTDYVRNEVALDYNAGFKAQWQQLLREPLKAREEQKTPEIMLYILIVILSVSLFQAQATSEISECMNSPCQNGGTCTDMVNGFTCACYDGYTGKLCDIDIDECTTNMPCMNEGICSNTFGGFQCSCQVGYTGNLCGTDIDECTTNMPCMNEGICSNTLGGFQCSCQVGYTGNLCGTEQCKESDNKSGRKKAKGRKRSRYQRRQLKYNN